MRIFWWVPYNYSGALSHYLYKLRGQVEDNNISNSVLHVALGSLLEGNTKTKEIVSDFKEDAKLLAHFQSS